jgi:hypothetical protein
MAEENIAELPLLVEPVFIWTGWGRSAFPCRSYESLVKRFGVDGASTLYPRIKSLEQEFYSSDAQYVAADLPEMAKLAVEHFKTKRPEVPDQIAEAFAWCYTYDCK